MSGIARPVSLSDIPVSRHRGGTLRILLSPSTVGCGSGFLGVVDLSAGEFVNDHYHPYSEEFLFVKRGAVGLSLDGRELVLREGDGIVVPIGKRHRLHNPHREQTSVVFMLAPLAPRPELGHVDVDARSSDWGPDTGAVDG